MATTVVQNQDGRYIAIGVREEPGGRNRVVFWNQVTEQRVRNMAFPTNRAPELAFDSSGTKLVVGPAERGSFILAQRDDRSKDAQSAAAPANDLTFGLGTPQGSAKRPAKAEPGSGPTARTMPRLF